jgi:hypothetical protein
MMIDACPENKYPLIICFVFYFIFMKNPYPQTLLPPWFILKPPVKTKNRVRRARDPIEPFVCDSEHSPINFRVGGRIVDVMKIALIINKPGIQL